MAAAVANATAIGGGFLFVPVFVLGFGLTATQSLRLSIATQAFGMTSGALGWSRQCIIWPAFWYATLFSLFGILVGNRIWVPDNTAIKLAFGIVSILVGVALIIEMKLGVSQTATRIASSTTNQKIVFAALCLAGGVLTAWVSIGIGEVVLRNDEALRLGRFDAVPSVGRGGIGLTLSTSF